MKSRVLLVALLLLAAWTSIDRGMATVASNGAPPALEVMGVRRIRTLTPRPWGLAVRLDHRAAQGQPLTLRALRLKAAGGEVVEEAVPRATPATDTALGATRATHAWIRFDPRRFGTLAPGAKLRAVVEADYESGDRHGTVSAPYVVEVEPWQMPPIPEGAHHSAWYIGNTHVHSLDFSSCDGRYSAHLSISKDGTSPVDSSGGVPSLDSEFETFAWNQGLRWMNVSEHCYCFACAEYCAVGERDGPCRHRESKFYQEHTCKVAEQDDFGPGSAGYANYQRFFSTVEGQNSNQAPETFLMIPGIELTAQDMKGDCTIRSQNHMHLTGFGLRRPEHGGLVGCPIDSYDWHGLTGALSFNANFTAIEGIRRLRAANPYQLAIINHIEGFGSSFVAVHSTREETLGCTGKTADATETGWELISTAVIAPNAAQGSDPLVTIRKWIQYRLNHGFRSVAYGAADFHYFWDNEEDRDPTIRNYERLGDVATVVYADSLAQDDIGKALKNGQTYATTGPGLALFTCRVDDAGDCIGPYSWMGEYLQAAPEDRIKVLVSYSTSRPAEVTLYQGHPDPASDRRDDLAIRREEVDGSGAFEVVIPGGTAPSGSPFTLGVFNAYLMYFRATVHHEDDSTKAAYTTPLWIKVGAPLRGTADDALEANFNKNRCLSRIDYLRSLPPYPVPVEAECTGLNLPSADDSGSQPPRLDFDPNCAPENCGGCCDGQGRCRKGNQAKTCGGGGEECTDCTHLARSERSCVTTPTGNVCGCGRDFECIANPDGRVCSPITGSCGCTNDGDCPAGKTCNCGQACSPLFPGVCVR